MWKNRLLTNGERTMRHMANDSHCSRCSNVYESEIHAIRDCIFPKIVWCLVVPTHVWVRFSSMPINERILWNLENVRDCGSQDFEWRNFFPIICWLL